jgi:hypothetical protein
MKSGVDLITGCSTGIGWANAATRLRALEPDPEIVAKVVLDALPAAGRDAMMRRLYRVGSPARCGRD